MQDRIGLLSAAQSGDRDVPGFGKDLKRIKWKRNWELGL